jgi:sulfonate transport system ATP-binding protein
MLAVKAVSKTYPNGAEALRHVDLDVREAEIVAIIGGSGCGKSTFLRIIAGLETATAGTVTIDGAAIVAPHPSVGLIFQEPRLLPWLTVAQNVAFGIADLPREDRAARVAGILEKVGLAEYAGSWPRELSGGQGQRVAIARALVAQPSVLLLDEPFSALDAFTRNDLQDHLLDLWSETRPILVVVTHDIDEALLLADRVVVMRPQPGRIAKSIRLDLARPRDKLSAFFEQEKRRILTVLDETLADRSSRAAAVETYSI